MKFNKKGFTLIELLAVVVILLAISVMAVSSISAAIERNKAKQTQAKIDIILSYAELYYDSHKNTLKSNEIKLEDIRNEYDLSDDDFTDAEGEEILGIICIDSNKDFIYKSNGICPSVQNAGGSSE